MWMESFNVKISRQQIDNSKQLNNLLSTLFEPGTPNHQLLSLSLIRENSEYGGSPEVHDLSFENLIYNEQLTTGKFRICYHVKFQFTCSDYCKEKQGQTSDWTFNFNPEKEELHFQGPQYLDLRSTSEEF
jgi:hypothetical protein